MCQVEELVDLDEEVDVEFATIAGGAGIVSNFLAFIKDLFRSLPAFIFGTTPHLLPQRG
jgi:hypothetical protein